MELKFKKLTEDAKLPTRAYPGDAGLDLCAVSRKYDGNGIFTYGTGLAVQIPYGHVGLLFPRSSIFKYDITLTNCVGVLDSGYRGEIMFKYRHTGPTWKPRHKVYEIGDRIGQLVVVRCEQYEPEFADHLAPSQRGEGGYGSSGK